jgi:hypothetical protein
MRMRNIGVRIFMQIFGILVKSFGTYRTCRAMLKNEQGLFLAFRKRSLPIGYAFQFAITFHTLSILPK